MDSWRLVVERKGVPVMDCPLTPGLVSIGRDRTNSIVLEERGVSRHHAILIVDREGGCILQDAGSRNGTEVGGRRVSRIGLKPGDAFAVGAYQCRVVAGEMAAAGSPPVRRSADVATADGSSFGADRPEYVYRQDPALFVGTSAAAQVLLHRVRRVAESRVNVLVGGESGAGKGVVGRLLHAWSPRAAGPFVVVNCAAIPGELIESELFGHRKGSFTGAGADRVGRFQAASGGTLFLDEVGDMSLAAQAKILRAIEERSIEPVGSQEPVSVDVRIVAATNKDLDRAAAAGGFRQDLLFRLATVRVDVPALRERPEDVALLANCLLAQLIEEIPRARGSYFTSDSLDRLAAHSWPGNVRELRNVVAQALVMKEGEEIRPDDLRLGDTAGGKPPERVGVTLSLEEVEAKHIARALADHGWNIQRTAAILGISRRTLRDRIERFRLLRPEG